MTSAVNGTVNVSTRHSLPTCTRSSLLAPSRVQVIPIPKALAQRLAGGRSLLTPTGLPAGFLKADEHLLVINDQYQTDIRQNFLVDLRVDSLPTLTASIPFVDAAKDNKTAFSYNVGSWVPQLLPSLVATLSGHKDTLAHFEPLAAVSTSEDIALNLRAHHESILTHPYRHTRRLATTSFFLRSLLDLTTL